MENRIVQLPEEKTAPHTNGFAVLPVVLVGLLAAIACFVLGCIRLAGEFYAIGGVLLGVGIVGMVVFPIMMAGFRVVGPNQAIVLTLFGRYFGTLRKPGFYHVNPFAAANAPTAAVGEAAEPAVRRSANGIEFSSVPRASKKISLKTRTLDNRKQKVNDALGNPIIIGSVVIWRVDNPTAAVFSVENFEQYLSIQCDSVIRNIARLYPYDTIEDDTDEKTLRGSSSEVSEIMQQELAARVRDAGLIIEDVRITTLAYSDEIAAAMLQRQQATAIIAARQKIVEGAVGMVKMAIDQLGEDEVVVLDEERKAALVSNLLVVLCGNKDAQPIVNSGSLY